MSPSEPADPPWTQRDSQPSISPIDLDHGVAVGDVTSHTAVVWTRADETAVVHLEYGPVDGFARAERAVPRPAEPGVDDGTVTFRLTGLEPATAYRYRLWALSGPGAEEPGLTDVPAPLVADGGTNWRDLNAFQRDVLLAIADLGDGQPYGRQIQGRLEEEFGEPVVESRLYQALNALVDLDLVRKRHGTIDARTKYYSLTEDARRLLEAHTQRCASVVGLDAQRRRSANP